MLVTTLGQTKEKSGTGATFYVKSGTIATFVKLSLNLLYFQGLKKIALMMTLNIPSCTLSYYNCATVIICMQYRRISL